ncbi:MAG: T9SS type A sorting domain-containing protein, partial [Owenweeksia sp.]
NDVHGAELYIYPKADITHWNTVGLDETSASQLVSVYPNPAHDHINLSLHSAGGGNFRAYLTNTNGQQLRSFEINHNTGMSEAHLPLNNLPAGVYILTVEGEHLKASTRIVVQP